MVVITIDYTGRKCAYCDKLFTKDDDIVVCPYCGTPVHRDCYEQHGKCPNEHLHGSFDYAADPQYSQNAGTEQGDVCQKCGEMNPKNSFYCNKCGAPMGNAYRSPFGKTDQSGRESGDQFKDIAQQMLDPYGGVSKDTRFEEDISISDMAKYVKQNTPYFMRVFYNIMTMNKSKFNFGAALFTGGYFLYRKMYKIGALVTAVEMAVFIFMQYVSYLITQSTQFINIYEKMVNIAQGGSNLYEMQKFITTLDPAELFIMYLPTILNILYIVLMIVVGFTANRLYFVHCKKEILKIKKSSKSKTEFDNTLQTKGGINIPLAVSVMVCFLIIMYLPNFLVAF